MYIYFPVPYLKRKRPRRRDLIDGLVALKRQYRVTKHAEIRDFASYELSLALHTYQCT